MVWIKVIHRHNTQVLAPWRKHRAARWVHPHSIQMPCAAANLAPISHPTSYKTSRRKEPFTKWQEPTSHPTAKAVVYQTVKTISPTSKPSSSNNNNNSSSSKYSNNSKWAAAKTTYRPPAHLRTQLFCSRKSNCSSNKTNQTIRIRTINNSLYRWTTWTTSNTSRRQTVTRSMWRTWQGLALSIPWWRIWGTIPSSPKWKNTSNCRISNWDRAYWTSTYGMTQIGRSIVGAIKHSKSCMITWRHRRITRARTRSTAPT